MALAEVLSVLVEASEAEASVAVSAEALAEAEAHPEAGSLLFTHEYRDRYSLKIKLRTQLIF